VKQTARWAITVSADIDRRVRRYLDKSGRKGDLAGFVEEAVRARLLEVALKSVPSNPGFARSANDVDAGEDPLQEGESRDERSDGSYDG
jgi:Ribbon-helix-helix domain